ncbi:MAG: hypothetical protein WDN25_03870 [Acetobacteraceae bacterium]
MAILRGSVARRGRHAWLVWDTTCADTVVAFPIRPPPRYRRRHLVPLLSPADRLLSCCTDEALIQLYRPARLNREGLQHSGEISGAVQCAVVQSLVRLHIEQRTAERWTADRVHRRRAAEESYIL